MRVIGIDPGTAIVGYGIIDFKNNKYEVINYGVITTSKISPIEERLHIIYKELSHILDEYKPEYIAIEDLFYFKNNKTIISVSQARGVILLAAQEREIKISNYTPLQVKIGVTGYGKAEKKQVQFMIQKFLNLDEIPKPDDAADALAIAFTHINALNSKISFSSSNSLKKINIDKNKISLEEYKKLIKS